MTEEKKNEGQAAPELSAQMEDYLEAIAHLQRADRVARAKDIAERLGVTRATVSAALKSLGEKGLINYQPYSHITLTRAGEALADDIIHRHEALTTFFSEVLQISASAAEENACRAEHVLDPAIIDRMIYFVDFLRNCPRTGEVWQQAFSRYCQRDGVDLESCKECVGQCMAKLYAGQKP